MERANKHGTLSESGKLFLKTCAIRRSCAELWMLESEEKLTAWLAANTESAAARAVAIADCNDRIFYRFISFYCPKDINN